MLGTIVNAIGKAAWKLVPKRRLVEWVGRELGDELAERLECAGLPAPVAKVALFEYREAQTTETLVVVRNELRRQTTRSKNWMDDGLDELLTHALRLPAPEKP
jgi:hypothetical protein